MAPIVEGVFAINKPKGISSAQVIRDVQSHFNPSAMFRPWLEQEQARLSAARSHMKKGRYRKKFQKIEVKIGHGGTLDPMATGVLILGVGSGTKRLTEFLHCTKSYETVLLFGQATDSYDVLGKTIARKPYDHITRQRVEDALDKFRGQIMQRPPIYSARRIQGKRLYEYAREGKEVPVEIEERPVTVEQLELVEWLDGGSHPYQWPKDEADTVESDVATKILEIEDAKVTTKKRDREDDEEDIPAKKTKIDEGDATTEQVAISGTEDSTPCPAPACRIRMTVTSGFYVRSLCHDLGIVVDSLGTMASLVRTRQGNFELEQNVFEYADLEKGEEVWAPDIEKKMERTEPA